MRQGNQFKFENTAMGRPSVWKRFGEWWNSFQMVPRRQKTDEKRLVQVWDDRLMKYRSVDLNNPDDPLWMAAYHVHAVKKGVQTGPAF